MVNEENITTGQEEDASNVGQEVQDKQEKVDDLSFVELYEQSLQEVPISVTTRKCVRRLLATLLN